MPIVTWCDEYSVNVEEIDIQHQKMLELVNHLHSAVEACIDKNDLKTLLKDLGVWNLRECTSEEQRFALADYPLDLQSIIGSTEYYSSTWAIW
ncbi:hypothetical protein [endosymbiont of Lamellibrachia barhami]|uniref:hypothetical protein n=1 Tax=endosymbiont of Lamellibrachia barhami TaxID=205975 RepID=UPI0015B1303D|nr:hypothetical protein [endosymbiont of Lamellibrachia barhami]